MKTVESNIKKSGAFTLFETLITIAIIGVIAVISLMLMVNNQEKAYGKLYAKAYSTLKTAAYNIEMDVEDFNTKANEAANEQNKSQADEADLKKFPKTLDEFCKELVGDGASYINTTKQSCTAINNTTFISASGAQINVAPSFMSTDGLYYYFTDVEDDNYFLMWVDINGERRPNTSLMKNKKLPDVVPFAISKNNGTVIPLGIPVYDIRYMKARVVYASPTMERDFSVPLTFSQARSVAYANRTFALEPLSKNFDADTTSALNFKAMIPTDFKIPTTPSSTLVKSCPNSGYNVTTDFPPCTVEVDTFSK